MTTAPEPLDHIAQRIAQQEAELRALRKEYESRKKQLDELTRRKQELETQLAQVERQIQGLKSVPVPASASPKKAAPATTSSAPASTPAAKAGAPVSLAQLLVKIISKAGRPYSIKELAEAVHRRNPSRRVEDLLKQVSNRVSELVKKGVLVRTPDQKAVTLPTSSKVKQPAPSSRAPAAKTSPTQPIAKGPIGSPNATKQGREQPSLRTVLTEILEKSKGLVGSVELGRRALAAGYQSKSKDFPSVVSETLRRGENIEHVKGQGYRLKK